MMMGFSGIGPGSLLLILAIVLLIFGTKRLKNLGGDLGDAVKGFKNAMSDDKQEDNKVEGSEVDDQLSQSSESLNQEKEPDIK